MNLLNYTGENFDELISKGDVIVSFSTKWCGPCKMLTPVFEKIANEYKDIKFIKVDRDEYKQLSNEIYKVTAIPTVMIFKDGVEVDSRIGFVPEELFRNWIQKYVYKMEA